MSNFINEQYMSVVELERMYFKHISFSRSDNHFDSANLQIGFRKDYEFSNDYSEVLVSLSCAIHDPNKELLNLEITICGKFLCHEKDEDKRKMLLSKNTLAILFPYLRSQVSLVTTQPDITPITIPPMNIESVFGDCP